MVTVLALEINGYRAHLKNGVGACWQPLVQYCPDEWHPDEI